jgi:hypothetical protein
MSKLYLREFQTILYKAATFLQGCTIFTVFVAAHFFGALTKVEIVTENDWDSNDKSTWNGFKFDIAGNSR